ncbi:MAG: hypothetical protein NXI24_05105 [bacterium]|nr:hypothetical protein [bacterium]
MDRMTLFRRTIPMIQRGLALALLILISLPACFTGTVQEDFWEPDPVGLEPVEFAIGDVLDVSVDPADGRLFIRARILNPSDASGDSGIRLYCPEPPRALAGDDDDASRLPGARVRLSAPEVCFREVAPGSLEPLRGLPFGDESRRYFPDLGLAIDLNFPQAPARIFRIAGAFDPQPFRRDVAIEVYLRSFSNYDRNQLFLVARESGEYLRLKIEREDELWRVVERGAGFYGDDFDRKDLERQPVSRLAPGAVVVVRKKNLIDGDASGEYRETAGVYAALAEQPAIYNSLARRWRVSDSPPPVIDVHLVSSVDYESRFYPGNLFLNVLAIPLFPLAVVADIVFIPIYVTSAVCLVDEGLSEAAGAGADNLLRGCLN